MTNEELQALPVNTIVLRKSRSGNLREWIKVAEGREPDWAWFRRVLKDGSISAMDGLILAKDIERVKGD